MDTLFGLGIIAVAGYFVIKWLIKETNKPEEPEIKVEPAKKIESDFVTGLSVAKEEVKVEVAKVETAVVEEAKEAAFVLSKEGEKLLEPVTLKVETIVENKVEEVVEFIKKVEIVEKTIEVVENKVEEVVEEVKVATRKVKAKAKAIEEAVEEKIEQLEEAVKKTRAKKKAK